MLDFDIILGMTWLSLYHDIINYNAKFVTLDMSKIDKLEQKGVYQCGLVKIISLDTNVVVPSNESVIEVSDFFGGISYDIFGMPMDRNIDFCINLEPSTHHISTLPVG